MERNTPPKTKRPNVKPYKTGSSQIKAKQEV